MSEGSEQVTEINRATWNRMAPAYQRSVIISLDDIHYGPMIPGERELRLLDDLGDLTGRPCLDAGCGGGQNSIALARRGAQVTGVDISGVQLAHARRLARRERVSVSFLQGDICRLDMLPDAHFHLVISVMALSFVSDLDAAIAEIARVLMDGGAFIWSMPHPIDRCLLDDQGAPCDQWSRYWPSRRRVPGDDRWDLTDRSHHEVPTIERFYTVEDMANTLAGHGFVIRRIDEPQPLDPRVAPDRIPYRWADWDPEGFDAERLQRVPPVMIFKATREAR